MPGWPMWYWKTEGKDEAKVRRAAGYFDVVNFASRVKCPVLIGVGLIDTVCPSPGVFAAYNQFQGPKEIVVVLGRTWGKEGLAWPLSCPIERLERGPWSTANLHRRNSLHLIPATEGGSTLPLDVMALNVLTGPLTHSGRRMAPSLIARLEAPGASG